MLLINVIKYFILFEMFFVFFGRKINATKDRGPKKKLQMGVSGPISLGHPIIGYNAIIGKLGNVFSTIIYEAMIIQCLAIVCRKNAIHI